jgi:uncharacterized protein with GYD domain
LIARRRAYTLDAIAEEEESRMPTYVGLINWTEQGVKNFKDTADRADSAREQFEQMGVQLTHIWWTLGQHDLVAVLDSPDEETVAAALLRLGSLGNVRTTTMRAFSQDEMRSVIEKAG